MAEIKLFKSNQSGQYFIFYSTERKSLYELNERKQNEEKIQFSYLSKMTLKEKENSHEA